VSGCVQLALLGLRARLFHRDPDLCRSQDKEGSVIHVTDHACQRFIERCRACTLEEAKSEILSHAKAIEAAAAFACEIVRLGDGARLVLDGTRVLTVYAPHTLPRQCRQGVL
jgi:hypothetical protein